MWSWGYSLEQAGQEARQQLPGSCPSSLGPDAVRLDCMKGKGVTGPQGKVGCSIEAQWGVSMWGQLSTVTWENTQAGPHPELRSLRVTSCH